MPQFEPLVPGSAGTNEAGVGSGKSHLSAFDQGRRAGAGGTLPQNPFGAGSPDHRNWALGHSFGERDAEERRAFAAMRPEASAPDRDETED